MTLQLYAAFVLAVTVLMLIPGPNVALIAANSTRYGPRLGLVTVAGVCAAFARRAAISSSMFRIVPIGGLFRSTLYKATRPTDGK